MDNLIELIILFFVIYSFLNMIIAGKKEQKSKENFPREGEKKHYEYTSPSHPKSTNENSYEFPVSLEDLFGIKLPESQEEVQYKGEKNNRFEESESWDPEKEFEEKVKQREVLVERSIEKNIPDIDYDKTPSYENGNIRRVKIQNTEVYEEKKFHNKQLNEIKRKLKNPDTLKELFIISEILNKPKSLRK